MASRYEAFLRRRHAVAVQHGDGDRRRRGVFSFSFLPSAAAFAAFDDETSGFVNCCTACCDVLRRGEALVAADDVLDLILEDMPTRQSVREERVLLEIGELNLVSHPRRPRCCSPSR
jgi:predicted phage gp36 major capsid-like protein